MTTHSYESFKTILNKRIVTMLVNEIIKEATKELRVNNNDWN